MTDDEFLTAMRIRTGPANETWPQGADPFIEVLRIDDLRSTYCEQLEKRIAQQALEIEALRNLVGLKRQGDSCRRDAARFRSVVKKVPGWLLPALIVSLGAAFTAQSSFGQPEYTRREHVQCIVCHEGSWSTGKYTAAGRYYMKYHSFKGYRSPKPAG